MTDREKILDKIQKCLRLSKSSNPHEAAAALRQAQKLMALHSISEEDLVTSEVESALYVSYRAPFYKKTPLNFAYMVGIVCAAFGVDCVIEPAVVPTKRGAACRMGFRYFGPKARVEMAVYTNAVLERAVWDAWNAYRKEHPWAGDERGARMGFWVGWLKQVRSTVIDFYATKKEAQEEARAAGNDIVPVDEGEAQRAKNKTAITTMYGDGLGQSKTNTMELHAGTHHAGREAAKDFQLHRPMEGEKQRQLGHH